MAAPMHTPLRHAVHRFADAFGIAWSGLCVIHCIALPLVFVLAPTLLIALHSHRDPDHALVVSLLWLARWESLIVVSAAAIAILSTGRGLRVHAQRSPLALALLGTTTLAVATSWPAVAAHPVRHPVVAAMGGALLVAAHIHNLRSMRRARLCPRRVSTDAPVSR